MSAILQRLAADQERCDPTGDESAKMSLPRELPVHCPPKHEVQPGQQHNHPCDVPAISAISVLVHIFPGKDCAEQTKQRPGGAHHGSQAGGHHSKNRSAAKARPDVDYHEAALACLVENSTAQRPKSNHVHDKMYQSAV